jgi:hypothetical protein
MYLTHSDPWRWYTKRAHLLAHPRLQPYSIRVAALRVDRLEDHCPDRQLRFIDNRIGDGWDREETYWPCEVCTL